MAPQWYQMNKAPLTSKGGPGSPLNSSLEEEERQGYDGLNESFLTLFTGLMFQFRSSFVFLLN